MLSILLFTSFNLNTETVFYTNGTTGPYKISDKTIFVATDSVFINDSLASQDQYILDYNQGIITFKNMMAESQRVRVRYRQLSFIDNNTKYWKHPESSYQISHRDTDEYEYPISNIQYPIKEDPVKENTDLDLSGSKTISVDFGSKQSLGLEQSTRINLKGNLEGVNVTAVLSDVGNPIPPEGTTKELREFDKILIKVSTNKFIGSYGDNDLSIPLGELGTINKKITGVLFNTDVNKTTANFGYAKTKGLSKKLVFYGQDLKQGPYYLTKVLKNASIVPGTENVYLQGKRMIRGESEDYTVDYSQGAVTFTNRQIISSFSRIEIDFEYTTEEYNRYLYNGNFQSALGGPISNFKISGGVFSESDDKSQNLSYDLSDAEISYLSTVDVESSRVWLTGVKYVGSGNGDYLADDSHYVYVGLDSGDYDVKFTYVGRGYGDYDYDNLLGGFRYIGLMQGKYITKVLIQLPEQNRIYDAHVKWKLPIGVDFGVSGFLSQRKRNRFASSRENFSGYSYQLNAGYTKERFKLLYNRTERDARFYFPGTDKDIDFNFYWAGIKQESLKYCDEIKTQVKPFDFLVLDGGSGWLKSLDNKFRERYSSNGKILAPADYTFVNWKLEYYPSLIRRYIFNLTPKYRMYYPAVELYYEKQNEIVNRYVIPSFLFKFSDEIDMKLSSYWSEVKSQNRKTNQVYKWEGNFTRPYLYFKTMLGRQLNKIDNTEENKSYFGNVTGQVSATPGLNVSFDYLQQQAEVETKEINYVWVGNRLGNYKRNPETGQFYFDPQGDYIQQFIPSGMFITTTKQKLQISWDFYRLQFIDFDGYYLVNIANGGEPALNSSNNSRQINFTILPYIKDLSIRLTNTYDFSKDNQYWTFASKRRFNNNRIGLLTQKFENLPFEISFEFDEKLIERLNQGIEVEKTEQIYTLSPRIGYSLNFQTDISYTRTEISKPLYYSQLGEFWMYKSRVAVTKNIPIEKATNLNTSFSITRRTTTVEQLPYDINLYEPKGITPEMKLGLDRIFQPPPLSTFTVRRSANQMILNVSYSFIKYPSRPVEHNFSFKVQANF